METGNTFKLTVFVVSDATGETAARVVRSVLVQFPEAPVEIQQRGKILEPDQIGAVVREAAACGGVIVHTLVSHDLRHMMLEESRALGVDAMDLMGPVLDRLSTHLNLRPQEQPGLFQQLAEARTRQIEAVEFAFRHDDGQHADELGLAEIVLVGVSRTMKTPTTLHLAYRGWFAANVPVVPEIPVPEELLAVPPARVFCLVMTPVRLQELRRFRAHHLHIGDSPYASLPHIQNELRHSQRLRVKQGWRELNVTGKSVEEVAHEIVLLLPGKDRGRSPLWQN